VTSLSVTSAAGFLIEPEKRKKNMEALVFALIAVRNGYNRQESIVPEPAVFQPFDPRALKGGLLRRYIDGSYSGGTETRTSEIWYWDAVGWILCINA
jgi:hypothetical protein